MMLGDFRIFSCQISLELSLCVSRGVVSPAVYLASLMVVLILFPCISHGVRTRSLDMASPCVKKLTWKICYLIYHAVIEHRAGTREDIAGDIDDYVDPKIIVLDQVFNACLMPFLLEIILGHQVIFLIYII